jgi:hypothetical protein
MNEIEKTILTTQLNELMIITKELSTKTAGLNFNGFREELNSISELTSSNLKRSHAIVNQISNLKIPESIEVINKTTIKLDNISFIAASILGIILFVTMFFHYQLKNEMAIKNAIIEYSKTQKMPTVLELVRVNQISVYDYLLSQRDKQLLHQENR